MNADALVQAAPYVLGCLVALAALGHTVQAAAHALDNWSIKQDPKLSKGIHRAVVAVDATVAVLDVVAQLLPRFGVKRQ